MVQIIQNLVKENKYSIKCPYAMTNPIGITVHNTANSAPASNEISYMISNPYEISFHFAVDEVNAVQGIPLNRNSWHASDGHGDGNMKTISIEIARSTHIDESLFDKAEDNAAQLVAKLCKEYGWTTANVYTHQHWAIDHKYCPHKTLDRGWDRFLKMVQKYLDELNTPAPTKYTTGSAIVLKNEPSYNSSTTNVIATYRTGTYYIWSDEVVKGRVRITNSPERVMVKGQVTAWINNPNDNVTLKNEEVPKKTLKVGAKCKIKIGARDLNNGRIISLFACLRTSQIKTVGNDYVIVEYNGVTIAKLSYSDIELV